MGARIGKNRRAVTRAAQTVFIPYFIEPLEGRVLLSAGTALLQGPIGVPNLFTATAKLKADADGDSAPVSRVIFSEPVQRGALAGANFKLQTGSGVMLAPTAEVLSADRRVEKLTFAPGTPFGNSTLQLNGSAVRAAGSGVALGAADVVLPVGGTVPAATTIYVDASTPAATGSQNGLSWGTAYASLQTALGTAVAGQTIEVAQGTYYPANGTNFSNASVSFQLVNNVAVMGGYGGNTSADAGGDPNARNASAYLSILSGQINPDFNSYTVVVAQGLSSGAVLDGFTISGGFIATNRNGAGMEISGGNPTISNCIFSENESLPGGGGMTISNASPAITNCTFVNNTSENYGGDIWTQGTSAPVITNCSFSGNYHVIYTADAIYNSAGSTIRIVNCVFSPDNNEPSDVIENLGVMTLVNCTFAGSVPPGDPYRIGLTNFGTATVTNCIFYGEGNLEILQNSGSASVTYSDIQGGFAGVGNINADPLFVDTPSGHFELTPGSPAIDAGNTAAIPAGVATDFAGNPRVVGVAVDMGAFEYGTPAAPAFFTPAAVSFAVGVPSTYTIRTLATPVAALTVAGTIPVGITFTDNGDGTATLAGTPTEPTGIFGLSITASNGITPSATQLFSLTVGVPPSITSAGTAIFDPGMPNSFLFTTTGFPASTVSISGTLPLGVTLINNGDGTATLSGAPFYAGGLYPVSITASNGVLPNATASFVLAVAGPPSFISRNKVIFLTNQPSQFTIATAGLPAPVLSESGDLPAGLSFIDNGNGTATLAGVTSAVGTYNLVLSAANGFAPNAAQAFILIVAVPQAPQITSANHVTFTTEYNEAPFTVTTAGAPVAAITETGNLPAYLSFVDNGDGTATLSGVPNNGTGGTYILTLTANNGLSPNSTQTFTLSVDVPPVITSSRATFTTGTAGSFTIKTTGLPAPALTESGVLPGGLTFADNGNGTATISGTPAAGTGGVYVLKLSASNGSATSATQNFSLTVDSPAIITSANPGSLTAGLPGTFKITTSCIPTATSIVESGALPAGISFTNLGNGTATLAGTATATGNYHLTITASNNLLPAATQTFVLSIDPQNPATYYVDANTPAAVAGQDGKTWATAFASLQSALAKATFDTTIDVAQGTYLPTTGTSRTVAFQLGEAVAVYGGFAGNTTQNPGARNVAAYPTILSGDIGAPGVASDNSFSVVTTYDVDASTVLDGFTVTGGNANSVNGYGGGGMANAFSGLSYSPAVNNCTFTHNYATDGGAIYNSEPNAIDTNCTFIDNSASYAGAIYNANSTGSITNCTFSGNSATAVGGAIYNNFSVETVTNCTFTGNTATGNGGAADDADLQSVYINSTFTANTAASGGAIFCGGVRRDILTGCNFSGNMATNSGGALDGPTAITFTSCAFTGNSAASGGAAYGFNMIAIDCTFAANSASANGGAMNCQGSGTSLENCTFQGNSSSGVCGGLYLSQSSPTLTNCILWGDSAPTGGEIYEQVSPYAATVTYSDIEGGFTGIGNINADPQFVNPAAGNFQLQPTSPCVNVANNAAISATGVTTDLAGNPRIVNGVVDMGAYEVQSAVATWTGQGNGVSWSDPNNWSGQFVPTQSDVVTIPAGFANVQVGAAFSAGSLISSSPLEIQSTGALKLFGNSVLNSPLTIDNGGSLDIQANSLTINFAAGSDPVATIRGYLKSAYNGGVWTGSGLTSSTVEAQVAAAIASGGAGGGLWAIGYADGSVDLRQTIAVGNQLVIRPANAGDANMDGSVNMVDLGIVAQNLSRNGDWASGDFNYDGRVSFLDIGILAQNLSLNVINTPLQ